MLIFWGIMLPFLGTSLGAACVLFMKKSMNLCVQRGLAGFAAGVMTAASVWSLLLPAIEQAAEAGKWTIVPVVSGFWIGILFLLLLDWLIPYISKKEEKQEETGKVFWDSALLLLAVTIHNIPEGMAVGAAFAGYLSGNSQISAAGAILLAVGIAVQNFPEGAIISLPLQAAGAEKGKAFTGGLLSGVVEPLGALLTILAAQFVVPLLPYFLSFAAGAMLYVVAEELLSEAVGGKQSYLRTLFFAAGFSIMMVLDVVLG